MISDAHFPGHTFNARTLRTDGIGADALLAGIIPLFELDAFATPVIMMAAVSGDSLDPAVEEKYRKALGYDGSILTSNRILAQRFVADREKAMRETSEKLYEQLELDGVSDAEKQRWLFIAAQKMTFSYECLEPCLAVYDKIYKNFGIGDGIFSWCRRPHPQEKK